MQYTTDYQKAVNRSFDLLLEEEILQFPLNPFQIIDSYGWKLVTYSELAFLNKCTVNDIINLYKSNDAFTIKTHSLDMPYIIVYNDNQIESRIIFSLTHEIGHILLNHFKYSKEFKYNDSHLLCDNFNKKLYRCLENEASCFARNALCPAIIVQEIEKHISRKLTAYELMQLFGLSKQAANARSSFCDRDLENTIFPRNFKLLRQCKLFINLSRLGINIGDANKFSVLTNNLRR